MWQLLARRQRDDTKRGELEVIKKGITCVKADSHSQEPQFDIKYSWIKDPIFLPNNRNAVEAMLVAYVAQVHEVVEKRAVKNLTKGSIANRKGLVWYISHLVAPNPHSVTTPV